MDAWLHHMAILAFVTFASFLQQFHLKHKEDIF